MTTTTTTTTTTRRLNGRRAQRGTTLVEAMAAGGVLTIGLLGLLAAQTVGARQNHMAARQVRGVAVAQDVAAAVRQWPCCSASAGMNTLDARLANANAGNDNNVVESGRLVGALDPSAFDIDLDGVAAGAYRPPMPAAALDFNGDGAPDFRRYLHIRPLMDVATNTELGLVVSVVVAWSEDGGWRQVVLRQSKYEPGNSVPGI